MATFPSEEEKIFALGEEMSAGFKDNTDTYPAPPVEPATLDAALAFDDTKLKAIGWGGPKDKTPLAAPGRVRDLVIVEEGSGTIRLAWKRPSEGGKPSAYEVRCRERTRDDARRIVGVSVTTEATLTGQERGKELEYVVLAKNKAGDGPVSNVVVAVL